MKDDCKSLPPWISPIECSYISPTIKTVKVKKDKHGNFLVKINKERKWSGATYHPETKTISFSY